MPGPTLATVVVGEASALACVQEFKMSTKKPKSKGAFKHGAYAQEVILPGEDRRDYVLMLAELYEEWAPEGLTAG